MTAELTMATMIKDTIQVSTATAKRDFSQLVNQVYYGHRRVVVTSRGKPKVAIVKLKDASERITKQTRSRMQERRQALNELDQLHKDIMQETQGKLPDPVKVLHHQRHERDQQLLTNLH